MIYGYARVSTDGQSVAAQVKELRAAGAEKVFRETASGAKTDRAQLRRALGKLDADDVLLVTRLDRLARSTRDLLNTLAADRRQGRAFPFPWRHMGGHHDGARAADFDRARRACGVRARVDPRSHRRRPQARRGERRQAWPQADPHASPAAGGEAPREGGQGVRWRNSPQLRCQQVDDFEVIIMTESLSLTDTQLQKILDSIDATKHGGFHWETVVPVFVSALLAMCVGIGLEYFKGYREKKKTVAKKQKDELSEINLATIALAYNLELITHFVFQNILPHYDDSHAALVAVGRVAPTDADIAAFLQTTGNYRHMMMTAPELNFLEYDFFAKLPFVLGKEPDLLKQSLWSTHTSRVLRKLLQDRNNQIDFARAQGLKGIRFADIGSAI